MISGFWWVTAGGPSPCPFNTVTSYHRWGRRWRRRGNQAQNEQRHDAGQHWGNIRHLHQVWSLTQFFHFWTAAASLHLREKQIKHSALLFFRFPSKRRRTLITSLIWWIGCQEFDWFEWPYLNFFRRLVRPFTVTQLNELLQRTGSITDFWIDKIKSTALVEYSSKGNTSTICAKGFYLSILEAFFKVVCTFWIQRVFAIFLLLWCRLMSL